MKTVRVVVAEDNPVQREQLVASLRGRAGVSVVGAAEDGVEALRMIREILPDVVVCDMVMPRLDGFAVLEEVRRMPPERRPGMIALTALSRDDFITRAMNLGVSDYLIKPADPDRLVQRILALGGGRTKDEAEHASRTEESAEQTVAGMLLHIGVPAHLDGYRFLLRSVMEALEHPDRMNRMTHMLYPAVARHFNTTVSCVERSIRHAINMTWCRSGAHGFEGVLDCRTDKPTNCELIALLSERVRLNAATVRH